MILKVIVDERTIPIEVPDYMLAEAADFFSRMDSDMDAGWQMSRQWVKKPDGIQRCKIAADKILTALESGDEKIATLMAGYILRTLPGVDRADIDTGGDMSQTEFAMADS